MKLFKIKSIKSSIVASSKNLLKKYKFKKNTVDIKSVSKIPFDFKGGNWNKDDKQNYIALIWGVPIAQRKQVSVFYSKYRTAFVLGNAKWSRVEKSLSTLPEHSNLVFIGFNNKLPLRAIKFARKNKFEALTVENALLDSLNPPIANVMPFSLIINKKTTRSKKSALESILQTYDFDQNPSLLEQAKTGISLMQATRVTNEFNTVTEDAPFLLNKIADYSILVIGQKFKKTFKLKNEIHIKLVEFARRQHPEADIFFLPYPGSNDTKRCKRRLDEICTVIDGVKPLFDILSQVDHIYTFNSKLGFDAVLLGKKVNVFGSPFYAKRGHSLDYRINKYSFNSFAKPAEKSKRRYVSLEALFAGAYFLAPTYIHPISKENISFFDLISYFFVEKIKHKNIFEIPKHLFDIDILRQYWDYLAAPAQLLLYLQSTTFYGLGKLDEIMMIAKNQFKLADFGQFSHLLVQTSNYDSIVAYADYSLNYVASNIAHLIDNPNLLNNFFYNLANCLKNSRGRVISRIPNLNEHFNFEHLLLEGDSDVLVSYLRCLSYNIQYEEIEEFIERLTKIERLVPSFIKKLCDTFSSKPVRSERNALKRNIILRRLAAVYKQTLTINYPNSYDAFLNRALYHKALDEVTGVQEAINTHRQMCGGKKFTFANKNIKAWGSLSKRSSHFLELFNYLLQKREYQVAKILINICKTPDNVTLCENLWLDYYLSLGKYKIYIKRYVQLSEVEKNKQKTLLGYVKAMVNLGEFETAKNIMISLRNASMSAEKRVAIENVLHRIVFSIRAGEILNSYPQPKMPKGVVFIASQKCFNTLAMIIPSLIEAKRMGYAVINLTQGMLPRVDTGLDFIDKFTDSIPAELTLPQLSQSWYIDWKNRIVSVDEVNYYQGFYEGLSLAHRRFFIDINQPAIHKDFIKSLQRADTSLTVCKQIYEEVCGRGIPAILIAGNSHATPVSVMRDFCIQKDHPLLSFVNANVAYESYFSNLGGKYSHTMCVIDMTLHKNSRAPFLPRKDIFEDWYKKNFNNQEFAIQANALINVNRNQSEDDSRAQKWIEYLSAQKKMGKKIICCFGKVPCDLGVTYDGGPAHQDMADWISHTVSFCGNSDDVILLVKPHPHELRPEIALDLVEGFIDLIDPEVAISSNIKLLAHGDINTHALSPFLDLAVFWNGTALLELTAQGVPVMACSHFGRHDYPIELFYPENREQYKKYLLSGDYIKPSVEIRKRAAYLLCFMGTPEISILNEYALRPITNDKIGIPRWQEEKVKCFLEHGDDMMKLAALRILEKFEQPKSKYEALCIKIEERLSVQQELV